MIKRLAETQAQYGYSTLQKQILWVVFLHFSSTTELTNTALTMQRSKYLE